MAITGSKNRDQCWADIDSNLKFSSENFSRSYKKARLGKKERRNNREQDGLEHDNDALQLHDDFPKRNIYLRVHSTLKINVVFCHLRQG